ncbi:MAG: site-specific integrase [Epsilonproteobacteria bacterium]|nr:site-specific integrase [Campylobacterota bacterium]
MYQKTLKKRIPTNETGIFYKSIIDKNNKEVDKVYIIRFKNEDDKDSVKTIGKHSEGIRLNYCKAKRDEIITKIRLGEELPHIAKQKEELLFDQIAHRYFDDKYLCKDIEKERKRYINHIQKHIGFKYIFNVSPEDIENLQKHFINSFAPRTVNHLIFLVSTIYKHAIKKNLYSGNNPASSIDGLKVDNKRERFLTQYEIDELFEEIDEFDLWLFVKLSLSTGGRIGTIMSIKKKDLQLDTNSVTLMDHKNTKSYKGFYNDELKEALKKHISSLKANDTLIRQHRITIENKLRPIFEKLFNSELEKSDRKNRVVIHTLRHTFASHLAMSGVSIILIQKLMNHSNIEMTMRYAHLAPDNGLTAVKGLYINQYS